MTQYVTTKPRKKNAPGQGRPSTVGGGKRTIYVADTDWQDLKEIGAGNASEGMRVLLDNHRIQSATGTS